MPVLDDGDGGWAIHVVLVVEPWASGKDGVEEAVVPGEGLFGVGDDESGCVALVEFALCGIDGTLGDVDAVELGVGCPLGEALGPDSVAATEVEDSAFGGCCEKDLKPALDLCRGVFKSAGAVEGVGVCLGFLGGLVDRV